jgi:DNA helicase-2/ATP-dependent DNA helicase PcrA
MTPEPVVTQVPTHPVLVPPALGRSVVVRSGQRVPEPWSGSPRVEITAATLRSPAEMVATLHQAWARRRPVAVELGVDPDELRRPARCSVPPYALTPAFELPVDRLHFLVWANAYDARGGDLVWWHGRKAARRFAAEGVQLGGLADVALADGTPVFVDGGPPRSPVLEGALVVHRWNAEAGRLVPDGHGLPRAALAPDQLAAVTHSSGPARVIAPAGSGKTRVLTERLRHLLADRHVDPSVLTVLAYNTKAADELRERCAEVVTSRGPQIRTLNSLGFAICNELGGHGRLQVLGEVEVRSLVESLFEIRHRANTDTVVPYIEALSAIRLGLVAPADAEELHPDAAGITEGFDRYRMALADAAALDFDEQIYRAIEILLTDPEARASAQERCRYLLVDEFQDLNPAHLLLVRLLCAPSYDCFGVGDDDQVLYGYSGATPEYLVGYDRYFPGAARHACEVSYRCPPVVVRAAANLLSYNRQRVAKTVRAAPGRPERPEALVVRRAPGGDLASLAVEAVKGWEAGGVDRRDMVVLARVNSALLPVQVALGEAGIPCDSTLTARVLGRTGVRTAFAYLRMGADPDRISRRDVEDTIRRPSRGIAPNVVAMLTNRSHTSVADIRRLAGSLTGRDRPKLVAYAADVDKVARACLGQTAAALRTIRVELGLGETMEVLDGSRDEPDRSTHHDDLLALESVAAFHPDPATFASWLREVLDRPQAGGPAVLISTVHRIKGREWRRVVVFGVSAGLFPHRLGHDTEGERRVLHVALTRASEEVLVLADAGSPSFFLEEMAASSPRRASGEPVPGTLVPAPAPVIPATCATEAGVGLRAWRTAVARREGMPPYVVLSDRHLEGIVAAAPVTLAELARCKGIGPMKLEKWGDDILAVLGKTAGGR